MLSQYFIAHTTLIELLKGKRLSEKTAIQVAKLPDELTREFTTFLSTSKFDKLNLNLKQYNIEEINKFLTDVDVSTSVQDLGDEDLEIELVNLVNTLTEYLKSKLPPPPSRFSPRPTPNFIISQYTRELRTINDPLTVVNDLLQGCLCRSQITTLSRFYPELLKVIQQSMLEAVISVATTDKQIPYSKLKLISILLQQEQVPEDLKKLLQSSFTTEKETKQPSGTKINANQTLTSSQKIEFK